MGVLDRIRRSANSSPDQPIIAHRDPIQFDHESGGLALRTVEPLEGTRMSLWNSIIPDWWSNNINQAILGTPQLVERVWVANRCQHMNANQISLMPLEFHGTDEPAWVSNPDPNLFPNGIGDALYAIVDQMYGYGWSIQYVTDFYRSGYPRTWTVIPSEACTPCFENGARVYKYGDDYLDPRLVVQIDRNPTTAAHGTSALRAYAQKAYGLLAAGNQSLTVNQGGIPQMWLESTRKLTQEQAQEIQEQWMAATARRNGAPPVVPPEIVPKQLSINPADLALLETQEFDARAVMTAYGTPSVLLNMALQGGLTYQNPAALGEMWWRFELRNTATRLANAFSAQMLPRGQWVSIRAEDTFAPLTGESTEDDEQAANEGPPLAASASPAQQPGRLTAIGGGG